VSNSKYAKVLQFPSPFSGEASEGRVIIEVHHHHFYHSPRQAQPRPAQARGQARRRGIFDRIGAWWSSIPPASRVAMIIVLAALLTM